MCGRFPCDLTRGGPWRLCLGRCHDVYCEESNYWSSNHDGYLRSSCDHVIDAKLELPQKRVDHAWRFPRTGVFECMISHDGHRIYVDMNCFKSSCDEARCVRCVRHCWRISVQIRLHANTTYSSDQLRLNPFPTSSAHTRLSSAHAVYNNKKGIAFYN